MPKTAKERVYATKQRRTDPTRAVSSAAAQVDVSPAATDHESPSALSRMEDVEPAEAGPAGGMAAGPGAQPLVFAPSDPEVAPSVKRARAHDALDSAAVHEAQRPIEAIRKALAAADPPVEPFEAKFERYDELSQVVLDLRKQIPGRQLRSAAAAGPGAEDPSEVISRIQAGRARLLDECDRLHLRLWKDYEPFLADHLIPTQVLFEKKEMPDDGHLQEYRTGDGPDDAIPIIWYKPATAYATLAVPDPSTGSGFRTVRPFEAFVLPGPPARRFGVSEENRPDRFLTRGSAGLRKTAHSGSRKVQVELNEALKAADVHVLKDGKRVPFAQAGVDGDHVKDLGFSGRDVIENYWPLDADVNRRAFTGFNSGYLLNYVEKAPDGTRKRMSQRLGGMIGKHFYAKDFMADVGAEGNPHDPSPGLHP